MDPHEVGIWESIKEDGLSILRKMDAVNLTGVWPNFPKVTGHGHVWAAGIYLVLLEEVMRRIVQRDADDLFVALVA